MNRLVFNKLLLCNTINKIKGYVRKHFFKIVHYRASLIEKNIKKPEKVKKIYMFRHQLH